MELKINIADLPPEGIEIPVELTREQFQAGLSEMEGPPLSAAEGLTGRVNVELSGRKIVVRGRATASLKIACDRCVEEFALPVEEEFVVVFNPPEEAEAVGEAAAEDSEQDYYEGDEVDIWPTIREHMVLNLPFKAVCSEICQGLCPVCGANLNVQSCDCRRESGRPEMAVLAEIKDKLPE